MPCCLRRLRLPHTLPMLLGALLLGACAQPGRIDAATPPDDFVLAVTVFQQPARTPRAYAQASSLPRSKRPARYIMESDGVLRASLGSAASPTVFPLQTRRLHPDQINHLWTLTHSTGVFEGAGHQVGSLSAYEPPYGQITALIEAFAAGRRGYAAISLTSEASEATTESADGSSASAATLVLTDALAELAWLPKEPVDISRELRARETFSDPASNR